MIDEALDYLGLRKSRLHSPHQPASRPLVTGHDLYEMTKPTENLIRQYPAAALATAFMVGVVIAWWVKRK
jgi:hypothetical protein